MKRLLLLLVVLVLAAFALGGCVDPDEAMPHYQTPSHIFY